MRVDDRPVPTSIVLDPVPSFADWPVRPVLAIETKAAPYSWDDGTVWDSGYAIWDAAAVATVFADATCAMSGLELDTGQPDDQGLFPAARLVAQLDNRDGRWSRWNTDGTPADHGPGQELDLWAHNAAGDWWLFSGRISRWDQRADDTIEVEAFDVFSDLAQPVGTYTPGAAGDLPSVRLNAILTMLAMGSVPHRFATGTVHLTAQPTDQAPLEEMQTVTASDGGIVYVDADGTIVSYDRNWRVGRDDQTSVPVISDNVCTAPVIVWEPILSTNDVLLADRVVLENVAGLRAVASVPVPAGRYVLGFTGQQWTLQNEGDALAAQLAAQQSRPRVALDDATLYLLDPHQPELWRAVDWRRFDRLRFLHDQRSAAGDVARLDVDVMLLSIVHEITAESWSMSFTTTRTISYIGPVFWDDVYVWDDPNPLAVWGY